MDYLRNLITQVNDRLVQNRQARLDRHEARRRGVAAPATAPVLVNEQAAVPAQFDSATQVDLPVAAQMDDPLQYEKIPLLVSPSQEHGTFYYTSEATDTIQELFGLHFDTFMDDINRQFRERTMSSASMTVPIRTGIDAFIAHHDAAAAENPSELVVVTTNDAQEIDVQAHMPITSPCARLIYELKYEVIALDLAALYLPIDINSWAEAVLRHSRSQNVGIVLGCARFGYVQLMGAGELMLSAALDEIVYFRFRPQGEWRMAVEGERCCVVERERRSSQNNVQIAHRLRDGQENDDASGGLTILQRAHQELESKCGYLEQLMSEHIVWASLEGSFGRITEQEQSEANPYCPICLDPYDQPHEYISKAGEQYLGMQAVKLDHGIVYTTCGHSFGYSCMTQWCQQSSSCPVCRRHIARPGPYRSAILSRPRAIAFAYNDELFIASGINWDPNLHLAIESCQSTGKWNLAHMLITQQFDLLMTIDERLGVASKDSVLAGTRLPGRQTIMREDWNKLAFSMGRQMRGAREYPDHFAEFEATEWQLKWLIKSFLIEYLS